jgi:hypothetical protein
MTPKTARGRSSPELAPRLTRFREEGWPRASVQEVVLGSLIIVMVAMVVMVGVGLGYIVTDVIRVVVMTVVIRVMIIWVSVIMDMLDVRLDDRLGE